MLVANFGGLMAIPTDPPYCLVYPNTYSEEVALENQNHFNTTGGPPGLHTSSCICCTLLQHADLTEVQRQKYNGSCLIVPRGTQYKIFPDIPGNSLLFNGDELVQLQRKRYQIPTYREEKTPDSGSQKEKPSSSHGSGDAPSSTSKEGESSKSSRRSTWAPSPKVSRDSPSRKSLHHGKCSPPSKEQCDKREKDSHSLSLKCKDKPHRDRSGKDKEGDKSPWKCPMSPP